MTAESESGTLAPAWRVPFNRPADVPGVLTHLHNVLASGHQSGDGQYGKRCEDVLEKITGSARAFLTTSGTDALEMAALLLDLVPGDEVIMPSFTFASTANAFVLRGARPVFVDVRADTLNLDEELVESMITPRTRAIVVVHYAGVACEMDAIMEIAARRSLTVIEDDAQGLFGSYRGRSLGTFGATAALSFHETKNISCGEGGCLLVNDERLVERAEVIREKGTDRAAFFRRSVERYTWTDVGSSFVLSDILAAVLFAQLEASSEIQARRRELWLRYADGLEDWAVRIGARLPIVPPDRTQPYHLFYVLAPSARARTWLIEGLAREGILAPFHYVPLHTSQMGRRVGTAARRLPVTEDIAERLFRLPLFFGLTDREQAQVIDVLSSMTP